MTINKKSYLLPPLIPIGFILILLGIFVFVRDLLFFQKIDTLYLSTDGVPFIIAGLIIFMFKGGFTFDEKNKELIKYISFAFITIWKKKQKLPTPIDYLKIVKKKKTLTSYYKAAIPISSKITVYEVFLVYNNGINYFKLFSLSKKRATEYGSIIANAYNVKVSQKN